MGLPVNEDLRSKQKWWIEHIVTPETVRVPHDFITTALEMHELIFLGNFVGAMELPSKINGGDNQEDGHADISEGLLMQTDQLGLTENTFATMYNEVWVDPATKLCYDTFAAGRRGVGQITSIKNSDGVIKFKKRRYWIATDWQNQDT